MERVALQEKLIEDLVAVLLIDIASMVLSFDIFHAQEKRLLTVLIIHYLQAGYMEIHVDFNNYGLKAPHRPHTARGTYRG